VGFGMIKNLYYKLQYLYFYTLTILTNCDEVCIPRLSSTLVTAEQMFKIFDKNGDGFITCDEMKKLYLSFRRLGGDWEKSDEERARDDEAEVNEFIKEADKDRDGKVNFEEFKAGS
jgi:Ca2+-binding EF-hand superfamily protein